MSFTLSHNIPPREQKVLLLFYSQTVFSVLGAVFSESENSRPPNRQSLRWVARKWTSDEPDKGCPGRGAILRMSKGSSGRKPTFLLHDNSERMAGRKSEAAVSKVTEIAERVAGSAGIEVVEVQLLGGGRSRVLRIFIDKPEGVTHADCELVSQQVGAILDIEDVIPEGSYTLEVSSPGVERKLSRPRDFERFVGQKAKVTLREPVENQRHWTGTLAGFEDGQITLEPQAGKTIRFPLAQVVKANLKFEW